MSWLNFKGIITLIWKEKINIVWKKKHSRSNPLVLIHSNVRKFFKKQHTNMLCCFKNRLILDESTNSMNEKNFSKENRCYKIYWDLACASPNVYSIDTSYNFLLGSDQVRTSLLNKVPRMPKCSSAQVPWVPKCLTACVPKCLSVWVP